MGIVFLWILFGVFSGLLAQQKNRSFFNWFIIGVLFGPFGLLVVFFEKLEAENNDSNHEFTSSKVNNSLSDNRTFHYEAKISDSSWNDIRKSIFKHLDGSYKLKRNDTEEMYFEVDKDSYIKVFKTSTNHKPFYAIDSISCGDILFLESVELTIKDELTTEDDTQAENISNDNTDKLIELSKLVDKGLLTKEEFEAQKLKLLG